MLFSKLKELQALATPGDIRVRSHPQIAGAGFIEADTYEGHPYHNVASGFEVAGDEDYPTRKADMELIVELWNWLRREPAFQSSVTCVCKWQDGHVVSPCGAHYELINNTEDRLAEKYRKLTEGR